MDWKIELVAVPVSAVDRAKAFYVDKVGFNADHDQQVNESLRFVQLTPPGSACSIYIGTGLTKMTPGSIEGLQMVVPDIEKAHEQLAERGVEVSDIENLSWGRFVYFSDPDGNKWAVQELPKRN
jgi:catechol 2,3-dioxygenase-like lactoylglutathione lyase family enzyme